MPTCLVRHELAPGFDHAEFFFWDAGTDPWAGDTAPTPVDIVIERGLDAGHDIEWFEGIGVAFAPIGDDGYAKVIVEVWDEEPPMRADETADCITDFDFDVSRGFAATAPEGQDVSVALPAGLYRARVSGHGFDAAVSWQDDDEAYEAYVAAEEAGHPISGPAHWVIRLWTRQSASGPVHHRIWSNG